jgi:hemerythrin
MATIEWTEELAVGIPVVDKQHQTLIQRLNDVAHAMEMHEGEGQIAKTLDFLIDYTDYHFSVEEKYMEEAGYPKLAEHQARHAEFKDTLDDLERDFREEGATHPLANALNTLLGNWLLDHITTVDHQFAEFLAGSQ